MIDSDRPPAAVHPYDQYVRRVPKHLARVYETVFATFGWVECGTDVDRTRTRTSTLRFRRRTRTTTADLVELERRATWALESVVGLEHAVTTTTLSAVAIDAIAGVATLAAAALTATDGPVGIVPLTFAVCGTLLLAAAPVVAAVTHHIARSRTLPLVDRQYDIVIDVCEQAVRRAARA